MNPHTHRQLCTFMVAWGTSMVAWGTSILLLLCHQPIDYEGFCLFMKTYLEADVPEELCQHLFTSFKRKICQASPETQHQSPGVSQHSTLGEPALPPSWARQGSSHPAHRNEGWGVAPAVGGIGASSQPCSAPSVSPGPLLLQGGISLGCSGTCPFLCTFGARVTPCQHLHADQYPVPLSRVLVQAATLHSAAPRAGCVGQAPNSASPSASRVDSWLVETSAERTTNCKRKGRTSPGSGW